MSKILAILSLWVVLLNNWRNPKFPCLQWVRVLPPGAGITGVADAMIKAWGGMFRFLRLAQRPKAREQTAMRWCWKVTGFTIFIVLVVTPPLLEQELQAIAQIHSAGTVTGEGSKKVDSHLRDLITD